MKRTFQEKILLILQECRTPRTLHYIKDKFSLNHQKLKEYIDYLINNGLVIVGIKTLDHRYPRQIITTLKGKALLKANGVKY